MDPEAAEPASTPTVADPAFPELRADSPGLTPVTVLEGDIGSGRTTWLLQVEAGAAANGFRVLSTAGSSSDDGGDYSGLRELLGPFVGEVGALPRRPREALVAALAPGPAPAAEAFDEFGVGLGALTLIESAAEVGPLLITVDDVERLDAASSRTLAFVSRRASESVVSMVLTRRPGTPTPFDAAAQVVSVQPLAPTGADALLRGLGLDLDEGTRARIVAEAEGNPLTLRALAQGAAALVGVDRQVVFRLPVTSGTVSVFAQQLDGIHDDERELLVLIAAADPGTTRAELVAAAAKQGVPEQAFHALAARNLISVGSTTLSFTHPLLRPALYGAASPDQRSAAHVALAAWVTDPLQQALQRTAQAAHSREAAGELETRAMAALRHGDRRAAELGLRRSAALSPSEADTARRLIAGAEVARQAGRGPQAASLLSAVSGLEVEAEDVARALMVEAQLAITALVSTRPTTELIAAAAQLPVGSGSSAVLRAQTLGVIAGLVWLTGGDPGEVQQLLDVIGSGMEAAAWEERVARAVVDPTRAGTDFRDGLAARLEDLMASAAAGVRSDVDLLVHARAAESVAALGLAEDAWTSLLRLHEQRGGYADLIVALEARARIRLVRGNLLASLMDGERALELAVEGAIMPLHQPVAAIAAMGHMLRGDRDRAERYLELALAPKASSVTEVMATWTRATMALIDEEHDRSTDLFPPVLKHPSLAVWALPGAAEGAMRAGREVEFEGAVLEGIRFAEATGSPWARAAALRARAATRLSEDPQADANAALAAAVEGGSPLQIAFNRYAMGKRLQSVGHLVAARDHLRAAALAFETSGTGAFSGVARRASHQVGGGPDPVGAVAELSEREEAVVALAAAGHTNKAIAELLHLSPRTVSAHLYRAYPKLGVSRRSQLAAALIERG